MLLVIGGHSRNIGKTSVVAGLIARLPQYDWTAVKITQFGHGVCASEGEPCGCAVDPVHPFAVDEELDPAGRTDTSRFLAAGARRAFWVRTAVGQLGYAVGELRRIFAQSANVIVESNSLLQFFEPDLYLAVLDPATADFKATSLRYLDRADGVILVSDGEPHWQGVAASLWRSKPRFFAHPPQYVPDETVAFVEARLAGLRRG